MSGHIMSPPRLDVHNYNPPSGFCTEKSLDTNLLINTLTMEKMLACVGNVLRKKR